MLAGAPAPLPSPRLGMQHPPPAPYPPGPQVRKYTKGHVQYPGLEFWRSGPAVLPISDIPGVLLRGGAWGVQGEGSSA